MILGVNASWITVTFSSAIQYSSICAGFFVWFVTDLMNTAMIPEVAKEVAEICQKVYKPQKK